MALTAKHCWITGASRGIGLALAQECAERGAIVHLCLRDVSEGECERLRALFVKPDNVHFHHLDLLDRTSIQRFLSERRESSLPVDVFVNNAGLLTGGLLEKQPIEDIMRMFQVNLLGPAELTHGLVPLMVDREDACLVNNASVSGIFSLPCASTYASAKAGLVSLTRSLESELKGSRMRTLTLITPGIKTRMFDEIPKLYGDHLDVSALSSISPEAYAKKVVDAIESGKRELWPTGSVRVALWLSIFFPRFFRWLSTLSFKR